MTTEHGWVPYTSGDNSHLSPEIRTRVERRIERRKEERGALLAIIQVRVYENDEEPQVSFPEDALLGVETDTSIISDVVARATRSLAIINQPRRQGLPAYFRSLAAPGRTLTLRCKTEPMEVRQAPSIVASFTSDFSDADVVSARSGLIAMGFEQLFELTSLPPKLVVRIAEDENQQRIDEVVAFLAGVDHVEAVRISYPAWYRRA